MIILTEAHLRDIELMAGEWPHKHAKQLIGYLAAVRQQAQANLAKADAEAPAEDAKTE